MISKRQRSRTDTVPGNEDLGYDATSPKADPTERCVKNGDGTYKDDGSGTGTWSCTVGDYPLSRPGQTHKLPDIR